MENLIYTIFSSSNMYFQSRFIYTQFLTALNKRNLKKNLDQVILEAISVLYIIVYITDLRSIQTFKIFDLEI